MMYVLLFVYRHSITQLSADNDYSLLGNLTPGARFCFLFCFCFVLFCFLFFCLFCFVLFVCLFVFLISKFSEIYISVVY